MKLQAIQAASVTMRRKPQPIYNPATHTTPMSQLRGEDQILFSGRSRYAAAFTLFTAMAALTALTPWGNSPQANTIGGRMDAPASVQPATVLPENPTVTAKAGLGRTVPVPLQVLEGTMIHYTMEGPKDDPEGFNTVGFKDKAGKLHWLVPDGFNGDMYGSIDYADFKQAGLKDAQRAVFVGLQSPEHDVKVNDQYVGNVFFVQRIQSPEGKVLWTNPEFEHWIGRIMSSPKLHGGLLKGEPGIKIPALLPNTPEPKNP